MELSAAVRDVQRTLAELSATISSAWPRLQVISESEALRRRAPGKWSRKEILGHLIDSASNNHQRFVRAQGVEDLVLPGYDQDAWVQSQRYNEASWAELLDLWRGYNLHLVRVMSAVPVEKYGTLCRIGESEAAPLSFLMSDYVRHLKHHLEQLA